MGAGHVPTDLLVTPALLSRFNVPSSFLAQFAVKPFNIQISTGGALGTMQFQWQYPNDLGWSGSIMSSAGSSWLATVDDVFSDLTFAARTYVLGETYLVDANGVVTGAVGLTAARFSPVTNACSAVTTEAMKRMSDAIQPPLLTWGDDATTHAAAWVFAILKRGKGATPEGAGEGDANIFSAEKMAQNFFDDIGENGRPDSMTDSASSPDGPLIAAYPVGDQPRGW